MDPGVLLIDEMSLQIRNLQKSIDKQKKQFLYILFYFYVYIKILSLDVRAFFSIKASRREVDIIKNTFKKIH